MGRGMCTLLEIHLLPTAAEARPAKAARDKRRESSMFGFEG